MNKLDLVAIFIFGILLGAVCTLGYQDITNKRELNGIYISGNISYERAKEVANIRDKRGDWVCINVAYDMSPKLAYETCVHECSHKAFSEIFAEKCDNNPDKCQEIIENA